MTNGRPQDRILLTYQRSPPGPDPADVQRWNV